MVSELLVRKRACNYFYPVKSYSVAYIDDLPEAFNTIRYYRGWADKISGQTIGTTPQEFVYNLRQPIGVIPPAVVNIANGFGCDAGSALVQYLSVYRLGSYLDRSGR